MAIFVKSHLILILVSLALLLGLLFLSPFLAYVVAAKRERDRTYDQLLKDNAEIRACEHRFRVKYCSEKRFLRWMKIFPWEAVGILCITQGKATFHTAFSSWRHLTVGFPCNESFVKYIGSKQLRNGASPWVVIESDSEKHYFSAETGYTITGARKLTKQIYEKLSECLK